jgi:ketosteroid isomerase-like protein
MSAENLQLVRELYEWMAAGEAEKAFELYDPEIEWDSSNAPWLLALGFEPIYRGHEGVRRAMRAWLEAWESIEYGSHELIDAGNEVLAFVHVRARGRASGVSVSYEHPQLWTLRDGKVVRMRVFGDRGEALRALSQSA